MKNIIMTNGIIAGLVAIGGVIVGLSVSSGEDSMQILEWLGYLIMIAAFTLVFIGIKRYRDQELGGIIRFGTAFALGLGITVLASIVYVISWEINLLLTDYAFINDYTKALIDDAIAAGMTGAELDALIAETNTMKEQYANAPMRLIITFFEIFPVGLLITLISAAVLRRSEMLPASG